MFQPDLAYLFPQLNSSDIDLGNNNVRVFAEDFRYTRKEVLYLRDGSEKEIVTAPVIFDSKWKNLVVDLARIEILKDVIAVGAISTNFLVGGSVGTSGTLGTDATRDRLVNELIAPTISPNTVRKSITDTLGGALDATDIVADVVGANRWKLVAQFIFLETDGTDGQTLAEFGMHDTTTFPLTPTSLSGNMFARFVPASSILKQNGIRVTVQWTLRT